MKTKINKNEVMNNVYNTIASEAASNTTANVMNVVEAPANNNSIVEALKEIKKAVAAVKQEALSPRAICRAIRDTMQYNATIAALAAKIGLSDNANKKQIDAAAKKMLDLIPYYISTKLPSIDGTSVQEIKTLAIMQPTSKDNVYVARECKDIFKVVEAVFGNTTGDSVEVKCNKFYRFDGAGNIEESEKVTITRKSDKQKAKEERLKKVMEENNLEAIKAALVAKYGIEALKGMF